MENEQQRQCGEAAYRGYAESVNWVSVFGGDQLPPWDELLPPVQNAWVAAALAARGVVIKW